MKIELTNVQVSTIVDSYLYSVKSEKEQTKLALKLFQRNDNIDPFIALRKVIKQVANDHSLPYKYAIGELQNE